MGEGGGGQLVDRGEVMIDQARDDAQCLGDPAQGEALEALPQSQGAGGGDDFLPPLRRGLPFAGLDCRAHRRNYIDRATNKQYWPFDQ